MANVDAPRDNNHVPALIGTSNADGVSTIPVYVDSATNRLLVSATGSSGGTSSTFGAAFPATGTAIGAKDSTGTNMAALNLDASGFLKVNVAAGSSGNAAASATGAAVPASADYVGLNVGGNLQGAVGFDLDSGAGTEYNQGVSLRFAASGGSTPADTNSGNKSAATLRVVLATDQPQLTNKLLVTPDANSAVNVAQINGVTPLMGNGVSGTGSLRVNIASDNTAFAVNATLSAETTKVIGTVRVLGNAGAVVDGVNTAATAPANGVLGLGIFNTTEPSPTTGQSVGIQLDSKGRQRQVIMDAAGNTRGANVNASNQLSVSVDAVSATNISTNIAQMNGVTVTMGNGVSGTGVQRVAIASDNTVLPGVGAGATGSAVPANANYKGGNAITSLPTAATAGNLTGISVDKFGRQVVLQTTIRDLIGTQTTTISASTSETTIVTAGAAGVFNDLLMLVISNTSASTTTRIDFRDATAGSILFSLFSPAGDTRGFNVGGIAIPQTTAANNWTAQCATSTTDIRIYAVYAKNK